MEAMPFVRLMTNSLERETLLGATEAQQKLLAETDAALMSQMDAFIGVRGEDNLTEQYDVPKSWICKISFMMTRYTTRYVCLRRNGSFCAILPILWRSRLIPL